MDLMGCDSRNWLRVLMGSVFNAYSCVLAIIRGIDMDSIRMDLLISYLAAFSLGKSIKRSGESMSYWLVIVFKILHSYLNSEQRDCSS